MICKTHEHNLLASYEAVIEQGMQSFDDTLEVGRALARIRDEQLYKATHKTFSLYCESRWSISRRRAYQLIDAAALAENLCTTVHKLPTCERQIRPLSKLPESEQQIAWIEALEIAGRGTVTAMHVQQAVNRRLNNLANQQEPSREMPQGHVTDDLSTLNGQKFGSIYADPPWSYGNQGTRASTDNHYSTMTVDELCDMPIAQLAAEDAHLHLWTTNAFLPDSFRLISAWGFEYRSCFVWVKPQIGIGNYWRVSHEFLLLGIRGNAKRFSEHTHRSWAEYDRTRHSSKPEQLRHIIEKVSPGPYLELFGRFSVRGWTVFGNQIEQTLFDQVARDE